MQIGCVEAAKERCARVFLALQVANGVTWREQLTGGFEAGASITGGVLTAEVGTTGSYAVYAGKIEAPRLVTLISGYIEEGSVAAMHVHMSVSAPNVAEFERVREQLAAGAMRRVPEPQGGQSKV